MDKKGDLSIDKYFISTSVVLDSLFKVCLITLDVKSGFKWVSIFCNQLLVF